MSKGPDAFRTISEVAEELGVPQHVLRFWESRFSQVKPMKRGGGRRYYRPEDVALLRGIHRLLYGEGFTIRGVQKILRERGVQHVLGFAQGTTDVGLPAAQVAANVVALKPRAQADGGGGEPNGQVRVDPAAGGRGDQDQDQIRAVVQSAMAELQSLKLVLDRARE